MVPVPFCVLRFGRDWYRMRGWSLIFILAPFPVEEQIEGGLVRALVNACLTFDTRWPFIRADIYCADRWSTLIPHSPLSRKV